jgi:hypothetical protein
LKLILSLKPLSVKRNNKCTESFTSFFLAIWSYVLCIWPRKKPFFSTAILSTDLNCAWRRYQEESQTIWNEAFTPWNPQSRQVNTAAAADFSSHRRGVLWRLTVHLLQNETGTRRSNNTRVWRIVKDLSQIWITSFFFKFQMQSSNLQTPLHRKPQYDRRIQKKTLIDWSIACLFQMNYCAKQWSTTANYEKSFLFPLERKTANPDAKAKGNTS